jgi:8-oxo-dGTP diphosphatase
MRPEDQRRGGIAYTVVPRTLIFLTREGQILMLKGSPDKRLWAGKYNGIGGHLEPGESPYRSALRELREETGLVVESLALRAVIHITLPEPPGIVLFVFVGAMPTGEPTGSDEGVPVWVDLDTLPHLPLVEDLPELLPRLLEPGPVLFATYFVGDAGLEILFD